MPVTPPIPPDAAPDSIRSTYDAIQSSIGQGQVPLGYQMMAHVDAFLQDCFTNAQKYIHQGAGSLDADHRTALTLAASSAMNCPHCVRHHAKEAIAQGWTTQQVAQVLAIVATCTMHNVYFKFRALANDPAFESMHASLRAKTLHQSGLDPKTVELICIIVSSINSCSACTAGHTRKALALGLTHEQIDEAAKISAAMAAFNVYHRTQ